MRHPLSFLRSFCFVAIPLIALACRGEGEESSTQGTGNAAWDAVTRANAKTAGAQHLGVFGFDGTNAKAENDNIIHKLVDEANVADKKYYDGTNTDATNFEAIRDAGVKAICDRHNEKPFDAIAVLGYSRGAGSAMSVAVRLQSGCFDRNGKVNPVPVRWLGLLDPVVTSIEDTLVEGNTQRNFIATRCTRPVREKGLNPIFDMVLQKAGVISCQMREIKGTNHLSIGASAKAMAILRDDAVSVMPSVFGTAPTLSQPSAFCRAFNNDARKCLENGCSYENARCDIKGTH